VLPSGRYRTDTVDPTAIVPSSSVSGVRTNVISPARRRERTIASEEALTDVTMPLTAWLGTCGVRFSVVIVRTGGVVSCDAAMATVDTDRTPANPIPVMARPMGRLSR
jgi:hypothetical protein